MKTIKYFTMAALALLMTTACSNEDNDVSPAEPQQAQGITITAQLAPKEGGVTRAVVDNGDGKLTATWAEGEQIAILYDGTQTIATVKEVAGDGSATIEFEVASGTDDGTACTLIYPASAVDNDYKLKTYNKLFATQSGQLSAELDVRVGSGTIQTTTPGLTVTTQPQPEFSIFKLTLVNTGNNELCPAEFVVSDDAGGVITTVTQVGNPMDVLYVALPPLSAVTYWFNATNSAGMPYIARVSVSSATKAGKFYISTVKMATIGDVVLSNGKFAAKGTDNEQAVIAYIGSVEMYFKHFLAIAPEDASSDMLSLDYAHAAVSSYACNHAISFGGETYDAAISTCYDQVKDNANESSATAPSLTQGWRLPSVTDLRYIFDGLGHIKGGMTLFAKQYDGETYSTDARPTIPNGICEAMLYRYDNDGVSLRKSINSACDNEALVSDLYWFSSKVSSETNAAWAYDFGQGYFTKCNNLDTYHVRPVFAY